MTERQRIRQAVADVRERRRARERALRLDKALAWQAYQRNGDGASRRGRLHTQITYNGSPE